MQNGALPTHVLVVRKPKLSLSGSREKERFIFCMFRYLSRKKVGMLLLVLIALLAFMSGIFTVNREDVSDGNSVILFTELYNASFLPIGVHQKVMNSSKLVNNLVVCEGNPHTFNSFIAGFDRSSVIDQDNPCDHFAFPPPPPGYRRRPGPRPCAVCYRTVEQSIASMPKLPSTSPVLQHLSYYHEENPINTERHGGSDFGRYPSLKHRNESFAIKESMTVHCGFVKGCRPGHQTGFDIDLSGIKELEQFHEVIVASAIFGNYDVIQQPLRISNISRTIVPFYMFIDEETEAYMRNTSVLDNSMKVGLWRIILVRNNPYTDARRNGKIPKLLLHRLFPNVRYSIWIDGKLQLVADPYIVLDRFLWRQNATFAISRHYRRFDVFEEAEANKAAGKYDNASIDDQINFYRKEGLTPYSEAKLPITSGVSPQRKSLLSLSSLSHMLIGRAHTCIKWDGMAVVTAFIKGYHRDILERMPPPVARMAPPVVIPSHLPAHVVRNYTTARIPAKKNPIRRGKGEKKGSRRRRKGGVNREHTLFYF